jgi:hypothetical protein
MVLQSHFQKFQFLLEVYRGAGKFALRKYRSARANKATLIGTQQEQRLSVLIKENRGQGN